ncbi:MAG: hypothetical protein KAY46_09895, partial [Burkholderiaceae bacterium]|nr:hypothetical protein [Burkholderiaceae bacterium]
MQLSVVHPHKAARDQWCRALQSLLPQARVRAWPQPRPRAKATATAAAAAASSEPKPACEQAVTHFGVGWKPPADYFAEHPDLAAFFTAGAGVDHLLGLDGLPELLPIIRLEDAGMADQ